MTYHAFELFNKISTWKRPKKIQFELWLCVYSHTLRANAVCLAYRWATKRAVTERSCLRSTWSVWMTSWLPWCIKRRCPRRRTLRCWNWSSGSWNRDRGSSTRASRLSYLYSESTACWFGKCCNLIWRCSHRFH